VSGMVPGGGERERDRGTGTRERAAREPRAQGHESGAQDCGGSQGIHFTGNETPTRVYAPCSRLQARQSLGTSLTPRVPKYLKVRPALTAPRSATLRWALRAHARNPQRPAHQLHLDTHGKYFSQDRGSR
jgi:hypothetical protein